MLSVARLRTGKARSLAPLGMTLLAFACVPRTTGTKGVEPAAGYDLVIRNGRVLDGAGNPWVRADVAVRRGMIAKVGVVPERGLREIDAKGRYVSPGWIDMMDQSGQVLLENGAAENKLRMGVTSAIAGEGGTPVPASQIPGTSRGWNSRGSQSTSGATTARHRRGSTRWAMVRARQHPTRWPR